MTGLVHLRVTGPEGSGLAPRDFEVTADEWVVMVQTLNVYRGNTELLEREQAAIAYPSAQS